MIKSQINISCITNSPLNQLTTSNMNKLTQETKRLAIENNVLEKDVTALMSQVTFEEMHLELVNKELDASRQENHLLESLLESAKDQDDTILMFGKTIRRSVLMLFYLRRYIERTSPTTDEQEAKLAQLKENYEDMLKLYEMNPTYKSILEAECYEQELTQLVLEKRTKCMQLEAQFVAMVN